jgi:hypothetical protein
MFVAPYPPVCIFSIALMVEAIMSSIPRRANHFWRTGGLPFMAVPMINRMHRALAGVTAFAPRSEDRVKDDQIYGRRLASRFHGGIFKTAFQGEIYALVEDVSSSTNISILEIRNPYVT